MEGSFQKIIAAVVGVLILFIVPVYMAYEKIDDISYNLVLKLTQNFVDTVRARGYISPEMYSEFNANLISMGTLYDVDIEHIKKRNDPAICIYDRKEDGTVGALIYTLDYDKYLTASGNVPNQVTIGGTTYKSGVNCIIENTHTINQEIITDDQIVNKLFRGTSITKNEFLKDCLIGNFDAYNSLRYINENSYIMSEGDKINVTVKNKAQTMASIFYSMLTANVGSEEIARVYVKYGGIVKNDGLGIANEDTSQIDGEYGKIFKYRGQSETITLEGGTYQIQCWGAAGGGENGGKGSYVKGIFDIADETIIHVYVGGQGTEYSEINEENGGFNGGGNSYQGFGGGGASDVRLYKGEWDDTTSLLTRIIVAAGGGGSSKANAVSETGAGGNGGDFTNGFNGISLTATSTRYGLGADVGNIQVGYNDYEKDSVVISIPDTEKGSLGKGGTVDYIGAGAGGAGYFGGSAAHDEYAGGGGGISYIYDVYDGKNTTYKGGHNYPFKNSIINSELYSTDILELARDYINMDGTFKNITYIKEITIKGEEYKPECKTGDEVIKNVLPGIITNGGEGNGYVLIKKID